MRFDYVYGPCPNTPLIKEYLNTFSFFHRQVISWSRLTEDSQPKEQRNDDKEISSLKRKNALKIGGTKPRINSRIGYWNNDAFQQELKNLRTSSVSSRTEEKSNSTECEDDFTRLSRFRSSTNLTKTYTRSKDDVKQRFRGFKKLKKVEENRL